MTANTISAQVKLVSAELQATEARTDRRVRLETAGSAGRPESQVGMERPVARVSRVSAACPDPTVSPDSPARKARLGNVVPRDLLDPADNEANLETVEQMGNLDPRVTRVLRDLKASQDPPDLLVKQEREDLTGKLENQAQLVRQETRAEMVLPDLPDLRALQDCRASEDKTVKQDPEDPEDLLDNEDLMAKLDDPANRESADRLVSLDFQEDQVKFIRTSHCRAHCSIAPTF